MSRFSAAPEREEQDQLIYTGKNISPRVGPTEAMEDMADMFMFEATTRCGHCSTSSISVIYSLKMEGMEAETKKPVQTANQFTSKSPWEQLPRMLKQVKYSSR